MFDYKTDRLNYGDLLTPPAGFTLSKAVATTYSLQLESLTATTIALGLNESTDSCLLDSKISAFEAINKVSQKLIVFCEAGQIHIPTKPSPLHMLFEKSIIQVALPQKRKSTIYPSFHPKIWLLEYAQDTLKGIEKRYRFIVMSRNLTFDRSWDISVMLEGKVTKSKNTKSRPIKSFLEFLNRFIDKADPYKKQKSILINSFIEGIDYVSFSASTDNKPFFDFDILPLGITENNNSIWQNDELFNDRACEDIAVISPFVSHDIIEQLNNKLCRLKEKNKGILITRRTELSKLKDAANNFDVYVMKNTIIDGEDNLPENVDDQISKQQDIHAKMFLYRKGPNVCLYIGSMNASERGTGIYRDGLSQEKAINVELMVNLRTTNRYMNSNKFLQEIIGDDEMKSPFEMVDIKSLAISKKTTDTTNKLLQSIKKVCRLKSNATVINCNSSYSISIVSKEINIDDGITITICPLYAPELEQNLDCNMAFDGLSTSQLSELYCIKSSDGTNSVEKIILIPTKDIPKERDQYIVRHAINNKKDFADYVAFVLGDDGIFTMEDIQYEANKYGNGEGDNRPSAIMTSLYERMIRAACQDPKRLEGIKKIVEIINDETVVPKEFTEMYDTFIKALDYVRRNKKQAYRS